MSTKIKISAGSKEAIQGLYFLPKKMKISMKSKEAILFYLFVAPFILSFVFLKIFPIVYAMYLSFTNATGFNWEKLKFTGLKNYARILSDTEVVYSAWRTLFFALVFVPLQLVITNLIALLLTRNIKAMGFFRTVYYIPSIIPVVAGGMMWLQLYNKNFGFFNQILGIFGITVNWLGYEWVTASLVFMMLWGLGVGLLVSIAAIKNVPSELYEAAEIDGARPFAKFIRITLPMITPVNLYNLIMGIITALQIYAQPVLITPRGTGGNTITDGVGSVGGILGLPLKPNYLYVVHIYQQIFAKQRFGYGLALIWILFIAVVVLTLVVLKTSKKWVYYEVEQDGGGK